MSIELVYEFSYWASLKAPVDFGAGPLGVRNFFEVTGGQATGKRFTATAFGGGGDWVVLGPDGFGRVDVRLQFETDDGAQVYVRYRGLLELNEATLSGFGAGTATDYGDHYFRTTPVFETGDPRYAWLNQHVFIARGHLLEGQRVEYEVYRVG
jgi:uncharacterized protein DUF3237